MLGGPLVALFMFLALVGGDLTLFDKKKPKPSSWAIALAADTFLLTQP